MQASKIDFSSVNRAFSKQSIHFDDDDSDNFILQDLRKQVYEHVDSLLSPNSKILELNAGTGIDAIHFARLGHRVHATDLSDGMVQQMKIKVNANQLEEKISVQQVSFLELDKVNDHDFDFAFSNFGGLNCTPDLSQVAQSLSKLVKVGGWVTLVIMPPVCPWEIASILSGNRNAFRRFKKNGVTAHLEGEYFHTWYHSVTSLKNCFQGNFKFINAEGLASLTPPPYSAKTFERFRKSYSALKWLDSKLRQYFPFNRWADHVIVTFQKL